MTYIKKCPTVAASRLWVHSCFLSFFSRFFYACKMSWTTSRLEWFFFWHFCFHSSEETEKYPAPFYLQMICKVADARVKFGAKAISCQETKIGGENDPLKVSLKGVFFFFMHPSLLTLVTAAERAQRASSNIIRIWEKCIRWDEFSNSSLFIRTHRILPECSAPLITRMHCATNNSNKKTRGSSVGKSVHRSLLRLRVFFVENFLQHGYRSDQI